MPPSPKYPLKPLLDQRERKVDEKAAELGDAIRTREAAEIERERALRAQQEAETRAANVKAEEAARLERGELRAVDLARVEAWSIGAQSEINLLTRSTETAEKRADNARAEEAGAQAHLAGAMADRDVVAKDQERFDEKQKKHALAVEEEAAEEAFRGGLKK